MSKNNLELIRQALGAAESSIKLAKQLLSELEGSGVDPKPKAVELPGVTGIFDGENMVSENGQTFPVPANYASKSMLVVGDTLKLVEEGKEKRFKQIEHVKRHKTTGILTKKDGKWKVVTPEGSYKVLPAAASHFGADVGSEVVLHLPSNNLTVPYGAIESAKSGGAKVETEEEEIIEKANTSVPETKKKEEEKIVAKIEPVKEEPKEKREEPKVEVKKPEEKKVEAPKVEAPKPVAPTPKPPVPPAPVVAKPTPKETVVIKPEPLKAITIEPEPKMVEVTKEPVVETVAAPTKAASIEVTPEEDELT